MRSYDVYYQRCQDPRFGSSYLDYAQHKALLKSFYSRRRQLAGLVNDDSLTVSTYAELTNTPIDSHYDLTGYFAYEDDAPIEWMGFAAQERLIPARVPAGPSVGNAVWGNTLGKGLSRAAAFAEGDRAEGEGGVARIEAGAEGKGAEVAEWRMASRRTWSMKTWHCHCSWRLHSISRARWSVDIQR